MDENEIGQRLTKVEESTKSAHHRLDTLEGMQKEIRDLALSVNTLAMSVKTLCTDVTDQNCRIKDLETKPGKRWDQLMGDVMKLIATGVIGYLLGNLLR